MNFLVDQSIQLDSFLPLHPDAKVLLVCLRSRLCSSGLRTREVLWAFTKIAPAPYALSPYPALSFCTAVLYVLLCLLSIRAVCLVLKTMPGTQYMLKGQSLRASSPIKRSHVFMSYISIPISFVGPLGFPILLSPGGLYRFYLQATCFMALVGASGDHWLKSRAAGE